MKKFFAIIIFSFLWLTNAVAENVIFVENLTPEKLIEEADLGNAFAQYRLAKLIKIKGIKNWKDLDYDYYLRAAAKQGHAEAIYDWFHGIYDFSSSKNNYLEQLIPIKEYLIPLARKNEGHANLLMYKILIREINANENSSSEIARQSAYRYLSTAASLGSREAKQRYSHLIRYDFYNGGLENIPLVISLLEEASALDADYGESKYSARLTACSIVRELNQFYRGKGHIRVDGKDIHNYQGAMDSAKQISLLKQARVHRCSNEIKNIATVMLDEDQPDFLEIYTILTEANSIDEIETSPVVKKAQKDWGNYLMGKTALGFNDLETTRYHFSKLQGDDWQKIILFENREGSELCRKSKVKAEKCREFIFN